MSRKRIALVTINPEDESGRRVMHGVLDQCSKLGFDVAVIAPLVHSSHYFKDYLQGELTIYDIINFDMFDGVIVTPVPMSEEQDYTLVNRLLEKFKKECHIPVVSVNGVFGDYDVVYADEQSGIRAVAEHVVRVHGCRDIAVLTGPKDIRISEERVEGVREALKSCNLQLGKDRIVYGDFWYTSGEKLAQDIASGVFRRPEAVICASDHMAIGLISELIKSGISVPEDIIVTGFGGSMEAAVNIPTITTCDEDESFTGAAAVRKLAEKLGIKADETELKTSRAGKICLGGTCGCPEETLRIRRRLRNYMYTNSYQTRKEFGTVGISLTELLDSYISESFTAKFNAEDTIGKIYESLYLIKPYTCFYMCLNKEWLDTEKALHTYSDRMNMAIYSDMAKKLHGYPNHVFVGSNGEKLFDSKYMVPVFDKETAKIIPGMEVSDGDLFDKPQVYYFSPLHAGTEAFGYVVLQNDIDSEVRLSSVYRNYIRYINNALEMSRAKDFVLNISEHDQLTGLYNRRGMDRIIGKKIKDALAEILRHPEKQYYVLAVMIDMNNLKLINDNEGHEAGDEGLKAIADSASAALEKNEIAVRAGGDEFYIIGVNEYDEARGEQVIKCFKDNLNQENIRLGKGVETKYTAAAGYAMMKIESGCDYHTVLDEADVNMYMDKRMSKHGRKTR